MQIYGTSFASIVIMLSLILSSTASLGMEKDRAQEISGTSDIEEHQLTSESSSEGVINKKDAEGRTPLMAIVELGDYNEVFEFLRYPNVDINACDHQGRTAFSIAQKKGYHKIAHLILQQPSFKFNDAKEKSIPTTAKQKQITTANVDICSICLTEYDDLQSESIKLECRHKTHKQCLENFYKSLLIVSNDHILKCTICRQPLSRLDRAQLNLKITLDDRYQSFLDIVMLHLDNETIHRLNDVLERFINSDLAVEICNELFEPEKIRTRVVLQAISELLPLTLGDVRSGRLREKLKDIFPFTNEEMRSLLHVAVHQGYLSRVNIDVIRNCLDNFLPEQQFTRSFGNALWLLVEHLKAEDLPDTENPKIERYLRILKGLQIIFLKKIINYAIDSINSLAPISVSTARRLLGLCFIIEGLMVLYQDGEITDEIRRLQYIINEKFFPLRLNAANLSSTLALLSGSSETREESNGSIIGSFFRLNPEVHQSFERIPFELLNIQRRLLDRHIENLQPPFFVKYGHLCMLLGFFTCLITIHVLL